MKIVHIGAGSYVFTPGVIKDAIIKHKLSGSELVFVDLNRDMAELMAQVARNAAGQNNVNIKISHSTDGNAVLPGADFVILSAAVEGARRWQKDFELLLKAGIPEQARECGGLGGMLYAFRSISMVMRIVRDMEKLCPDAMLLNVTNPLPRVITAVNKYTRITAAGFCNAAQGGANGFQFLADLLGKDVNEIEVASAGLNHFAWLGAIRERKTGKDLLPRVREKIKTGKEKFLKKWLDEYDAVGLSGSGHMKEFLPYYPEFAENYCSGKAHHVPFHGDQEQREKRLGLIREVASGKTSWNEADIHCSWEHPVDFAVAIAGKNDTDFPMLNIQNRGYMRQLPDSRIVEVPVVAGNGKFTGREVPAFPPKLVEVLNKVSDTHELVADAAVKGSRTMAKQAIEMDPAISDKTRALSVVDEMIDAHLDVLPEFN